ncbi:MAG: hypothetical protein HOF21_07965 [Nitrospina sp.]|jgi:hypothetical protein|nr:hypothetical protein [Nitrospina sp.]MBT5632921.1 hypothetical protein [Nitrospina sp.]
MTTDEQGKQDESSQTPEERLNEIKKEEKEDASGYYSQGDSKSNVDDAAEFNKPVAPVQGQQEEMNMLKAVAFLGFGMAALAIIFILFFVRDLDTRVMGMDGTVTSLEEKIVPLKKHVDDSFNKVNEDISGLKNKLGNYERTMAVMELKRTLVTVQEMSLGDSPDIKAKSGEVVAGIESLLTELGAGTQAGMPAGIVSLEEAPAPVAVPTEEPVAEEPAPAEEATTHEAAVEEAAPVVVEEASEPAQEEPAEEASEESSGEASEESSEGGDDDEEEEDDE